MIVLLQLLLYFIIASLVRNEEIVKENQENVLLYHLTQRCTRNLHVQNMFLLMINMKDISIGIESCSFFSIFIFLPRRPFNRTVESLITKSIRQDMFLSSYSHSHS